MSTQSKIVLGIIAVLLLFFCLENLFTTTLLFRNPTGDELYVCLKKARVLGSEEEMEKAENTCFCTYPHFN